MLLKLRFSRRPVKGARTYLIERTTDALSATTNGDSAPLAPIRAMLVEPAIPYSLVVMLENRGAGVARNLRITSAQPKIIEMKKGCWRTSRSSPRRLRGSRSSRH